MHHREREQPFYNWLNGSCTKCSNTELNYVCGTCSVFVSKLWLLPLDMLTLWLSAQIDDIQESIKTFKKPRPRNAVPEIKTMHKKQILPSKFKWFLMNLKKNTTPSCFHFIKSFLCSEQWLKTENASSLCLIAAHDIRKNYGATLCMSFLVVHALAFAWHMMEAPII